MDESILNSIKKNLDIVDPDQFNEDVIPLINSAFSTLNQLGVGPEEGFYITGDREEWNDYTCDIIVQGFVKEYIYLMVRQMFDPPQSSFVADSISKRIAALEWRLNVQVDHN